MVLILRFVIFWLAGIQPDLLHHHHLLVLLLHLPVLLPLHRVLLHLPHRPLVLHLCFLFLHHHCRILCHHLLRRHLLRHQILLHLYLKPRRCKKGKINMAKFLDYHFGSTKPSGAENCLQTIPLLGGIVHIRTTTFQEDGMMLGTL